MLLALDVGNTQVFGGVIKNGEIVLRFRKASKSGASSDETGVFFRQVLRENGLEPKDVTAIGICSVVPDAHHSLRNACIKYFGITPYQVNGLAKSDLIIDYPNPAEIGADRIANAIAAARLYPNKDCIIIDLGTATTFCALTKDRHYHGGAIMAGLRLSIEALESKTSKLPSVEIIVPKAAKGNSTVEGLQSGLYYAHLGAMKELIGRLSQEVFGHDAPFVIGTGGFSSLYEREGIFDILAPDLVLRGIEICGMGNI